MGFPLRRKREAPGNGPAEAHAEDATRNQHAKNTYGMSTRPSFGQWLKVTWLDILTFILMGALGLGVCVLLSYHSI